MSDDEDLNGTVLDGRWKVLELLGRGGMGEVYRARHLHLGTDVAIKVLTNTAGLSPSDVARFYRESELIGKLNHDHIIRVQDTGKTASGKHFFVMEYLRGPNLRMLLRDGGPLSWARTCVIVSQLCDALSAIHSSGVIHRDLKLQNIVLDPRPGRPDFVKLLDFGVAKSLSDDGQRLTQTGIVLGTLAYMAPEYLLGYPPDGRVDIYALGVIAFELLTGRLPTPNSATNLTLLQSQGVPAWAHEVVVRAMMRDPAQRFVDAEAFAAALAASPDGANPSLDESTTTRFVGPTNSVSNGHIDADRTTWSPPGGLHAPAPMVLPVDNSRQPPAPAAPEPIILALARPLPPLESSIEPGDAIAAVGSAEMTTIGRGPGSAGTTSRSPVKPPEAMAALVQPNAAPKLTRRALYFLIVVSPAVFVYTLIFAPSRPGPDIGAARELHRSGTGHRGLNAVAQPTTQPRTVAMTTAEQPTEPETTAEQPTEPETTAEQPTEPETAATQPTKPEVPKPPPPKVTGKLSYMKQLSKVKSAVKSCKVVGVGALKLSILIDGPTGKATAKVLGPALVIDEDSAKCPGEKIAEIEFERFKGTYSAPPSFFDLKK